MRQLKGGKTKETAKEKRARKKENAEIQRQIYTITLPILAVVFVLIACYVYVKSRPTDQVMNAPTP